MTTIAKQPKTDEHPKTPEQMLFEMEKSLLNAKRLARIERRFLESKRDSHILTKIFGRISAS